MATLAVERVRTAAFAVTAGLCPQIVSRILGHVAQQGRLVERFEAVRRGDRFEIRLRLCDIDGDRAEVLAEKMRMLSQVMVVDLRIG